MRLKSYNADICKINKCKNEGKLKLEIRYKRISIINTFYFEQALPLAVSTYGFVTQLVQSALFCLNPKEAAAFCGSSLFFQAYFS